MPHLAAAQLQDESFEGMFIEWNACSLHTGEHESRWSESSGFRGPEPVVARPGGKAGTVVSRDAHAPSNARDAVRRSEAGDIKAKPGTARVGGMMARPLKQNYSGI